MREGRRTRPDWRGGRGEGNRRKRGTEETGDDPLLQHGFQERAGKGTRRDRSRIRLALDFLRAILEASR